MTDKNELKGLGGWLVLVGIGVVTGPIRMLFSIFPEYIPLLEDGVWLALTTEGSEAYIPYLGSLIIYETALNIMIFSACLFSIYFFFSKHYLFPRVHIGILLASLIFIPMDAWLVSQVIPDQSFFDPETTKEFMKALIVSVIWIPYLLFSQRVKATFVEGTPNKQAQPTI